MSQVVSHTDRESVTWLQGDAGRMAGVFVTDTKILVKFGPHVKTHRERDTINFVQQQCHHIPIPDVYDVWTETIASGKEKHYIAMSLMPGRILSDAWLEMIEEERSSVLNDYRSILRQLRQIPVPDYAKIGAIDGIEPAADSRGTHTELGGPFASEADFNEWLISLINEDSLKVHSSFWVETLRNSLAKTCVYRIKFTHEDLGPHSILVQGSRITAVPDWEYAGWYPEHWEYVKMIQFSRDMKFRCWAKECWEDEDGQQVFYDEELVIDQMLDSHIRNGERVIKRNR